MLKLVIEDDEGRKTVVPFVREEITIGRKEGNTIRLTERNVSRRHARLVRQNGSILVEDLGSYNGIRINGERIHGQAQVQAGDLIQIGDYDLAIQSEVATSPPPVHHPQTEEVEPTAPGARLAALGTPAAQPPPLHPSPAAPPPLTPSPADVATLADLDEAAPEDVSPVVPEPEPAAPTAVRQSTSLIRIDALAEEDRRPNEPIEPEEAPRLVVLNTEFAGREFSCIRTELRIGRTDDNDIAIDHRSLSRTHAKLVREATGEWRIIDMESANGLLVNGEQYARSTLNSGDVVELGHVKVRFVGAKESYEFRPGDDEPVRPRGKSRLPLALGVLAVTGLALGSWFLLRGDPSLATRLLGKPQPVGPTVPPKVNETPLGEKLAAAKAAIDKRELDRATDILESCKDPSGELLPEAAALLAELAAEADFKRKLDLAEKALAGGKLDEAGSLLKEASATKLLKRSLADLKERLKVAEAKAKPPVPDKPVEKFDDARIETALNRLRDAKKQPPADRAKTLTDTRDFFDRCIKTDPGMARCHLGMAFTSTAMEKPDKAYQHYKVFLQLAPNHELAERIRQITKAYEASKGGP